MKTEENYGPWFRSPFPGVCGNCGAGFEENDYIRADGDGDWQCEHCA